MTHLTETDMREFEADFDRPTTHMYPGDRRYRLSGDRNALPGDIALCGHRKVTPWSQDETRAPLTCDECRNLKAILR